MKTIFFYKSVITIFVLIVIFGVCVWIFNIKRKILTCYKMTTDGLENRVIDLLGEDQSTAKKIGTDSASLNKDSIDSYFQKKTQLLKKGHELYDSSFKFFKNIIIRIIKHKRVLDFQSSFYKTEFV